MKKLLVWTAWASLPLVALAFHMGPGQRWLAKDRASALIASAHRAQAAEDFESAAGAFGAARAMLPPGSDREALTLRMLELRARMNAGELVESQEQLLTLVESAPEDARPALRSMLGEVSYSVAWMMRLEGAAEEEWKPETELARQQYRLLAETLAEPERDLMNLESVIRLERMSDDELKALPLPKNCKNCKNCSQNKRNQRITKSAAKKPSDARKQVNQQSASDALGWGKGS